MSVRPSWRRSRRGTCGRRAPRYDRRPDRLWRHVPWGPTTVWLRYAPWRVSCRHCGVRVEQVSWAASGSAFTASCEELVAYLAQTMGVLNPTAVTEAFQTWTKRSGLVIPFQGPHCLRHSYAVYLLRSGLSLKSIGDLLGHRTLESTCVYRRLAVDDLRDVALPLPAAVDRSAPGVAS